MTMTRFWCHRVDPVGAKHSRKKFIHLSRHHPRNASHLHMNYNTWNVYSRTEL